MKLSTRSRYGIRLMVDLARHFNQGPIQLGDVAKRQDISTKYLEQLIIPLKKSGLVKSVRGPKGGHLIAKSPNEVSVGDILRLMEGEICLAPCVENPHVCKRRKACAMREIWTNVTNSIFDYLDSITLQDLVNKEQQAVNPK